MFQLPNSGSLLKCLPNSSGFTQSLDSESQVRLLSPNSFSVLGPVRGSFASDNRDHPTRSDFLPVSGRASSAVGLASIHQQQDSQVSREPREKQRTGKVQASSSPDLEGCRQEFVFDSSDSGGF